MRNFSTNKRLIVILIVFIVFFALITFSLARYGNPGSLQQTTNDVTAWVARGFSGISNGFDQAFDSVEDMQNTYKENQRLKGEVRELYNVQSELETVRAENEKLKDELELKHSLSEYDTLSATVISRSPEAWMDVIIIDRGKMDDLELDMAVMAGDGLIGRVSEVSDTSAKVTLLTTLNQRQNRVSGQILSDDTKAVEGIIEGFDPETELLIMDQITESGDLEEGQKVVTSGLSGKTPASLPIGTVAEVVSDEFGLTKKAYLKPAADFFDISYVTVIKRKADQPAQDLEEEDSSFNQGNEAD